MAPIRWRSKEAREMVKAAEDSGYSVGLSGMGHLRIFNEEGRVVMHMGSSLSPRNVKNARAQIKREIANSRHNKETQK